MKEDNPDMSTYQSFKAASSSFFNQPNENELVPLMIMYFVNLVSTRGNFPNLSQEDFLEAKDLLRQWWDEWSGMRNYNTDEDQTNGEVLLSFVIATKRRKELFLKNNSQFLKPLADLLIGIEASLQAASFCRQLKQ